MITVGLLAKLRRMHYREHLSVREITRRTGLARNTVRRWLKQQADVIEPVYPKRENTTKLDAFAETLSGWLHANQHRNKHERRTVLSMHRELVAMGYRGSYVRVTIFARQYRQTLSPSASRAAFVPLTFQLGEAFQFDWSTEYAFVGGQRRRLELAHTKLCASRAFWLTAYFTQRHEMLFDAHARAFAAFGGIPTRGIYDNMKTAVDKVGRGKARTINARFEAMTSHYLFEPEFCNVASGWEKGIVEKNVQDQRRRIWRELTETRWPDLVSLNDWLGKQCRMVWAETQHPTMPTFTVAELWQDEQAKLMPCPKAFDGYVEHPVRVSSTALIHLERNRYSVPTEYAHQIVSLRVYPATVCIIADGKTVASHPRSFERDITHYDWQHYLTLIDRKPGALRNGAPFETMPEPLRLLQKALLKRPGGDRVMATFLAAVPVHGLDAILRAAEAALAVGKPSAEHVLYLLTQLKDKADKVNMAGPLSFAVATTLKLHEEPKADVERYDQLRTSLPSHSPLPVVAPVTSLSSLSPAVSAVLLASPALTAIVGAAIANGGQHVR